MLTASPYSTNVYINRRHATLLIRSPTGSLSSPSPPRSPACLYRPNDALSTTSAIPEQLQLWQSVSKPEYRRWWNIRPCIRWLHQRPNSANGLSIRENSPEHRAGIHGAKREFSLLSLNLYPQLYPRYSSTPTLTDTKKR